MFLSLPAKAARSVLIRAAFFVAPSLRRKGVASTAPVAVARAGVVLAQTSRRKEHQMVFSGRNNEARPPSRQGHEEPARTRPTVMKFRRSLSGGRCPRRNTGLSPQQRPRDQQWLQPTDETKTHQALIHEMRLLWHGRIENLFVVHGLPRITEQTKLFSRHRSGRCDPPSAPRPSHSNCKPHPKHIELLEHCVAVRDGVIDRIEIADGVPVFWGPANQSDR